MKKIAILGLFIIFGCVNSQKVTAQGQDTISVMYYNLLNYPLVAQERADTLKKIVQYVLPDMLVVNELTSQFGASLILANALNQNGITHYQQATFVDGPDTDNLLFYNSDKIGLKSQYQIPTSLRDISEYVVYYKAPDLAITNDTVFMYVYSCHLKASSGTTNETQRYNEAVALKNYMSTKTGIHNVLTGGDFNLYGDYEAAFSHIKNGGTVKLFDPVSQEGNWNSNINFKNYHTQSTRTTSLNGGSTGGLDDRFDFIFVSEDIQTGQNKARYLVNSYKAIGQDGQHFNTSLLNPVANGQVTDQVAMALHNMSDHLPVYMEIEVGGDVGIAENDFVNNFTFNSDTHELNLYLKNTEEEVSLSVYDLSGKLVHSYSANNTSQFSTTFSGLKTGIYIVKLSNGSVNTALKVVAL